MVIERAAKIQTQGTKNSILLYLWIQPPQLSFSKYIFLHTYGSTTHNIAVSFQYLTENETWTQPQAAANSVWASNKLFQLTGNLDSINYIWINPLSVSAIGC